MQFSVKIPSSSVVLVLAAEPARGLPSVVPGSNDAEAVLLLAGRVLILLSRGIIEAVFNEALTNRRKKSLVIYTLVL